MGSITVKNGTPMHGQSLCKTCTHGHWQKGFRESEEMMFCNWAFDAFRQVPFAVAECSHYSDTRIPSMDQMEDMATILGQSRRVAGFAKEEEEHGNRESVVAIRP